MKDINQILLPLDFGETTDTILDKASFLAKRFSADLTPVHAIEIAALYSNSPVIDMKLLHDQFNLN